MKLEQTNRIIIKIGSALLFNETSGSLNKEWLNSLAEDVKYLRENDKEVIIVSSGAIAMGAKDLDLDMKNMKMDMNQAVSAVGQIHLMGSFKSAFEKNEIKISCPTLACSISKNTYAIFFCNLGEKTIAVIVPTLFPSMRTGR